MQVDQEKSHALKVLNTFLLKLEASTNPFDVEANIYAIMHASKGFYERVHALNTDILAHNHPEENDLIHHLSFSSQAEYDARVSRVCVCGNAKEINSLVCWDCFKRVPNPLKYFDGTYEQWVAQRQVRP